MRIWRIEKNFLKHTALIVFIAAAMQLFGAGEVAGQLVERRISVDINGKDLVVYWDGLEVSAEEVVEGNAVSVFGGITVSGRVEGSAISLGGDVLVKEGGFVAGDAVAVGGTVSIEESGSAATVMNADWKSVDIDGKLEGEIRRIVITTTAAADGSAVSGDIDSGTLTIGAGASGNAATGSRPAYEKSSVAVDIDISQDEKFSMGHDIYVAENEEINGDVVVFWSDADIKGVVRGDAVAIAGDLTLADGARVYGDVVAIGGKIIDNGAFIRGDVVEIGLFRVKVIEKDHALKVEAEDGTSGKIYTDAMEDSEEALDEAEKAMREAEAMSKKKPTVTFSLGLSSNNCSYNRVDGFGLGLTHTFEASEPYMFEIVTGVKYRFALEERNWSYNLEFTKSFFDENRLSLGGGIYRVTDSNLLDRARIGDTENDLAALFFKGDFRDYFEREGFSGRISQYMGGLLGLEGTALAAALEYRYDKYRSLPQEATWSLFYPNREFRENPLLAGPLDAEETIGSLMLELVHDTRDSNIHPETGWYNQLIVESAGGDLAGDYSFEKYDLILRRYNRLYRSGWLDLRLWASYSEDRLPLMKQYNLGGPGTLRGYGHGDITTDNMNKMLLVNAEFRTELGAGSAQGGVFVDMGNVYPYGDQIALTDLEADAGFCLLGDDGTPRLDISKSLTDPSEPVRFTVRLQRLF